MFNLKMLLIASSLALTVILGGCVQVQKAYTSEKTSIELQSIQLKEFETKYKVAFAATMSVFQDMGYIISTANADTGFITANSPKSQSYNVWMMRQEMNSRKATAFIETMGSGKIGIRLNYVDDEKTSDAYGMEAGSAIPVEEPQLYQDTFNRIQKAIFVRTSR